MALAAGLDLTLPFLPTLDTWAQIAATLLFVFATGIIIRALWLGYKKPDLAPHSAPVAPFLVIDSLGTLKNAERGFAQMLVARMDELQGRVDKSIKVLEQAGAADKLTKPPSEHDNPFGPDAEPNSKLIRIVLESKVISPVEPPLELKFQGLDLTGVFSWVTTQVGPKTDSLRFTAHVDSEGIAIAGNIRALSLDGPSTIWIDPVKGAAAAIDELALQLYHLSLKKSNAYLGDFSSADFRKLIDYLFSAADDGVEIRSQASLKEHNDQLFTYFSNLLLRFNDWPAMTMLTAQTAFHAEKYEQSLAYYTVARDHELKLEPGKQNRNFLKLAEAGIEQATVVISARSRGIGSVSAEVYIRKSVARLDAAEVQTMRSAFEALYDAQGEGSYVAIAGLYGIPNWYSWHHGRSQHTEDNAELFLPWTRAFLSHFERAARSHVKDFALPSWDWTTDVPSIFTEGDRKSNPLFAALINIPKAKPPIKRYTRRFPLEGPPHTARKLGDAMQRRTWTTFFQSVELLSDYVHGTVGGNDGKHGGDLGSVGTAAFDPIFYVHRCFADRLWATWQQLHPEETYSDIADMELAPFGIKVRDVLDTRHLGYVYDEEPPAPEPAHGRRKA